MRVDGLIHSSAMHATILRSAALLVPSQDRAEWLAEWRSELWYVRQKCTRVGWAAQGRKDVTLFCLGAFADAAWLRRHRVPGKFRAPSPLESPTRCGLLLAALAALSLVVALFALPRALGPIPPPAFHDSLFVLLFTLTFVVVVLPSTTSLSLGEFPATAHSGSWVTRLRPWAFLAAKILCILLTACSCLLALSYATVPDSLGVLLLESSLWGSLFACRWAFIDQRRRCPVCLRLLTSPVWVGDRSRYFLEWNCTELLCPKGHGLLCVPECPTSWFPTQRWLSLDPSWGGLFRHN